MLLPDHKILELCKYSKMIDPYVTESNKEYIASYGPSSYGYDVRLGSRLGFFWPEKVNGEIPVIDLANFPHDQVQWVDLEPGQDVLIHPGDFVLAHTLETIRMPRNCTGFVKDKSSWARCGLAVQNTVLEAEWEGQVTLELSNHNKLPIRLIGGCGIAQVIFEVGKGDCDISYKDRGGKYMGQEGVVLPR